MEELFALRPGRYRHFKDNEYELLYVARHSETLEPMVVYCPSCPNPCKEVRIVLFVNIS